MAYGPEPFAVIHFDVRFGSRKEARQYMEKVAAPGKDEQDPLYGTTHGVELGIFDLYTFGRHQNLPRHYQSSGRGSLRRHAGGKERRRATRRAAPG